MSNKITLVSGDAENLNYPSGHFDLVTIGFGVRNFQNLIKGLKESNRILKKNGKLIILESSVPQNSIIKFLYFMFSRAFVPFIGSIFSKNKLAYNYLQKSAEKFPCGHVFVSILKECGFKTIYIKTQMFGAASIYVAEK